MRINSLFQIIFGIFTFVPSICELRSKRLGSGATYSARYCYSVWMQHMVKIYSNRTMDHTRAIAELEPGDN